MNNFREIDLNIWPRRRVYEFYRKFASPCFNVTVSVDAQEAYDLAKSRHESFFLLALYAITRAANLVPQFRQRTLKDKVVEFDKIAVMTPILTPSELFHQIWCEYDDDFTKFKELATPKIEQAKSGEPQPMEDHGDDFFCASCVPWIHFDSITQADLEFSQSIPILAWGKLQDGHIPISVKLNHCFIDGLHVARFFEEVGNGLSRPESLYLPPSGAGDGGAV